MFLALITISSCDQNNGSSNSYNSTNISSIKLPNVEVYAILNADSNRITLEGQIFPDEYLASSLDLDEILSIEILIDSCIKEYNTNSNNLNNKINLANYKRQYIPVLNTKGEKEVLVNCLCIDNNNEYNWRQDIVRPFDGGICYFHFKINLNKHSYYDFSTNSDA